MNAEQRRRLVEYDAEHKRLLAESDRVYALCAYHPCPPPSIHGIQPKACTCYTETSEFRAFMSLQSPVCNICGGWDKCKASCDALDKRF